MSGLRPVKRRKWKSRLWLRGSGANGADTRKSLFTSVRTDGVGGDVVEGGVEAAQMAEGAKEVNCLERGWPGGAEREREKEVETCLTKKLEDPFSLSSSQSQK